jgi:hypothetical protein
MDVEAAMTNEAEGEGEGKGRGRAIPLAYVIPDDLRILHTDLTIINHSSDTFYLNFYQMNRPPSLSVEELENVSEVTAICIARLALTPEHMRNFFQALGDNIRKYDTRSQDGSPD